MANGKPNETTRYSRSLEDYAEAILLIGREKRVARIKDIARRLGVKTPSVVKAVGKLQQEGLVVHQRYGHVELTPEGERLAGAILKRHQALFRFFHELLGVDAERAGKAACEMEHHLDSAMLRRVMALTDFCLERMAHDAVWAQEFRRFIERRK